MTIAEKITRAKADYDDVYEGGKEEAFSEVEPINTELEQILYGKDTGGKGFYDEFWDNFQNYGNKTDYRYAFSESGFVYIRPKYKIIPQSSMSGICSNCRKLKAIEKEYFDFSKITGRTEHAFFRCEMLTEFPDLGVPAQVSYYGWWQACWALHTIEVVRCNESTTWDTTFLNCTVLENVRFEGVIGKNVSFPTSNKLSKASITNVIEHLSPTATGQTATFAKDAVNKAFETSEGANDGSTSAEWNALIAPKSNWTISLV